MQETELNWVGGAHRFALGLGEIRAVQSACDAGPEEIVRRIIGGTWREADLFHPIKQGLVGAEVMKPDEAGKYLTGLFEDTPLMRFKPTALAIMSMVLVGPEGQTMGEPERAEAEPPRPNGTSQPSMETAP